MRMTRILVCVAVTPLIGHSQQVRTVALGTPDAKLDAEWTSVRGVRELRDGRLVVLDAREQAVKLVDFKAGTTGMIGRKGSGPGEYQLPLHLLALPGDSSAVFDMANNGAPMVITPAGKAGNPLPGVDGPHAVGFVNLGTRADAQGRVYRGGYALTTDGESPVERLNRASGKIDTVGWYHRRVVSPLLPPAVPGPRPRAVRAGKPIPFASFRDFAVTPNGSVVVVSPDPYRITTFEPGGRRVDGPLISYDRPPVTDADKAAWRAERSKPVASIMYNRGGGTTAGYRPAEPVEEPEKWPESMPPYTIANVSTDRIRIAPDGMIWIERAVNATMLPLYDVLSPGGTLAYRVALQPRSRIVGFGPRGIYVVRLDDDDIEHLERFRFPTVPAR